ncbi:protein involved in polysaccharide export with SLBB domain [Spirosoma lacussanchae]|uniref:polysaccharide biosynthesis/export family protein n=1 Tax=Spirosoma lacussanchae TaxID=1884249 RepID=UPI0011096CDE|nr:SLBB domain-containing protein [Spirosoma lacussanchae]
MQNLRINHVFPPKSFSVAPVASLQGFAPFVVYLLLTLTGLTVRAQVTPAPAAGGATTSPGTARPGATPSAPSSQPGRGLPAGVNVNNLPPSVQQQINQRAGQLQNQGRNGANGRAGGATGADGNAATTERSSPNGLEQGVNQNEEGVEPNEENSQEVQKSSYELAREQEKLEIRRKLFGFAIFNDPALKASFQPNTSIATPRNYMVGPGDQLNIRIYGYSETDFSQTVSSEGYVYFANQSGIGPVFVSGLTVEQAKARMESRLATKYVGLRSSSYGPKNTFLEVSLGTTIRSIRVTVTGEALRPGTYTMSSLSTVMNAIYQAGGPNELGSFRKVQLIRNNRVAATLDLYDYLLNGTQRNDIRLQDNDNIRFSTYTLRVEVTGATKRNNLFEMMPGETLDRLLFYAGDFAATAYKGRVKVQRLTDRERKIIDVTATEYKSFAMQDGDQVSVEQLLDRFENQITIEGAVFRPGQYSLDQNKTLKQLISSAEGLKGDAFMGRVNIVRTREDLAIENITVNLGNILAGTDPDVILQREDQVIIPSKFDLAEPAEISVLGEVTKPNPAIPYMANMTLNDALLKAGGLRESAAASVVEIVRRKKDVDPRSASAQIAEIKRFNINRDLSTTSDEHNFLLEPFDQVIVRRSPNYAVQTYAAVEGEVILPGLYAIRSKDQKVSDLVGLAGGLTPQAYIEGATLVRRIRLSEDEIARRQRSIRDLADNVTTGRGVVEVDSVVADKPESIGINLKKIMERPGSSEDILVQEGDVLRIPKLLETVRIQGEVMLPNTVKYRSGQTFQDYISQVGGFTSKSQRRKSFVVYANGSVDRTRKFMFFNVYPRVAPGSEVVIPKKTTNPLTPQQVLGSATGIASSLITLIVTVIALSRVGN